MMRLSELEPRWMVNAAGRKIGLTFLCPCCKVETLFANFRNPPDGGDPPTDGYGEIGKPPVLWTRTGETFDTMTLTPSIDASGFGHWHGFITAGAITP